MQRFEDWLKVRENVIDEGWWDTTKQVGKAALQTPAGRMALGTAGGALMGGPVGAAVGALGAAATTQTGRKIASNLPWVKRFRNWKNDPRSMLNAPANAQEAHQKASQLITQYATKLGLSQQVGSNPSLAEALRNIIVSILYGEEYGVITKPDLSNVWKALQVKTPNGETIAQTMGFSKPSDVLTVVPGTENVRKDQALPSFGFMPGADDYDQEVDAHNQYQNWQAGNPAPATQASAPPTSNIENLLKAKGSLQALEGIKNTLPKRSRGRKLLNQLIAAASSNP